MAGLGWGWPGSACVGLRALMACGGMPRWKAAPKLEGGSPSAPPALPHPGLADTPHPRRTTVSRFASLHPPSSQSMQFSSRFVCYPAHPQPFTSLTTTGRGGDGAPAPAALGPRAPSRGPRAPRESGPPSVACPLRTARTAPRPVATVQPARRFNTRTHAQLSPSHATRSRDPGLQDSTDLNGMELLPRLATGSSRAKTS